MGYFIPAHRGIQISDSFIGKLCQVKFYLIAILNILRLHIKKHASTAILG